MGALNLASNLVCLRQCISIPGQVGGEGIRCNVTLEVKEQMHGPIYLYFQLDDYFQNHRR